VAAVAPTHARAGAAERQHARAARQPADQRGGRHYPEPPRHLHLFFFSPSRAAWLVMAMSCARTQSLVLAGMLAMA